MPNNTALKNYLYNPPIPLKKGKIRKENNGIRNLIQFYKIVFMPNKNVSKRKKNKKFSKGYLEGFYNR